MPDRGGSFYDDPTVFRQYAEHRRPNRFNPNQVVENPAVWNQIGDPTGVRVLDLGCGNAQFGRDLLRTGAASYLPVDGSTACSS